MKKIFGFISVIAVALTVALCVGLKSGDSVSSARAAAADISAEYMKQELFDFIGSEGERKDRTPFSDGEKKAAEYILEKMSELESFECELKEFSYSGFSDGEAHTSQNVICCKRSENSDAKSVIIATNYDNNHSDFKVTVSTGGGFFGGGTSEQTVLSGTGSHGAYRNGASVATLTSLASRLDTVALDYDLYVVFFGCGELWDIGAKKYLESGMEPSQLARTVLMVNLQGIGGDNLYAYTDEVETAHGKYLFDTANQAGVALSEIPDTLPHMPAQYMEAISYAHLAMLGASANFMERGVPSVNLFGGTFDSFSYGLFETAGKAAIGGSKNDTIAGLEEAMPNYADKMAQTAKLLYSTLSAADLSEKMTAARGSVQDYSFFMNTWAPQLMAVGLLVIFAVLLIPVAVHFEKKYPPVKPKRRKVKVAVFGMDYETPSPDDIYIDLKKNERGENDNPFKGY